VNRLIYPSLSLGLALISPLPSLMATMTTESVQAQTTQTLVYVDPNAGNDRTGRGSRDRPYGSLTQALAAAPAKAVIQLAEGTYSEETGESFPIVVRKSIEIRGTPNNRGYNVKIEGGGPFNSRTGAGQNITLALLGNSTLTGVSVTNPRDRGIGVWIEGANPTVLKNTFQGNNNTGVAVNGKGRAIILDNYFYNNSGNGMVIYGQSQPMVKNNTFERTGFGVSITEDASPQLIGNEIKHNRTGIMVEGNAQPILRENLVTRSTEDGLVAIANARPDLGTANEPGRNIFRNNQGQAIKNLTRTYTIPASGNQIAGETAGQIDTSAPVARQNTTPRDRTLTPLANNPSDSSAREQVWSAPSRRPLPLLEPNNRRSSQPPPLNIPPLDPVPSNSETGGNEGKTLQDILVLEPDTSPSTSRLNPNALPVPNGNIPTGNPFRPGASPKERVRAVGGQYRVVVEIRQASDKSRVKEIVPDAFTSQYQGRAVMQVGIFRSAGNADEIRQALQQAGLLVRVIPAREDR
jgi:parallel beta-helix repeat protein